MDEDINKLSDLINAVHSDITKLCDISAELKGLIDRLDAGYSAKLIDSLEQLHIGLDERVQFLKQKSHILTTVAETNSTEIFDIVIPRSDKSKENFDG